MGGAGPCSGWGVIYTSTDGVIWTWQTMGQTMYEVIWDSKQFVTVGGMISRLTGGVILSSPDGISWKDLPVVAHSDETTFNTISYSGDLYIVLGRGVEWGGSYKEFGFLLTSNDGKVWNTQYLPPAFYSLSDITWGNNQFVVVGSEIWTSP